MRFVPVVDKNQKPLMPTTPSRARKWIKFGKATPFWKRGVFCVRLNVEPSSRKTQLIAVGIDPGSKKEGYSVKSRAHTYLNIQSDAVTWVKERIDLRRTLRRSRRQRNSPYRRCRHSMRRSSLLPSMIARWQLKVRICRWLLSMFPISSFAVEDVKAKSYGGSWGIFFSHVELGKNWFYANLERMGRLHLVHSYETKGLRSKCNLKKSYNKLSDSFLAHAVDAWVIANSITAGMSSVDNREMLYIVPFKFFRRQLHLSTPSVGGKRRALGGTRSMGFKRGSIVKSKRYGVRYVGGSSNNRISLHSIETGERMTRKANPYECKFLTYSSWRFYS
jgi:hypothetical protein